MNSIFFEKKKQYVKQLLGKNQIFEAIKSLESMKTLYGNLKISKLVAMLKQCLSSYSNLAQSQIFPAIISKALYKLENIKQKNITQKEHNKLLGGGSCISCNCDNYDVQEIKEVDIEDIGDLNNDSIIFYKYEEEKEEIKIEIINNVYLQYNDIIQSQRMFKVFEDQSFLNEVFLIMNQFIYQNIEQIIQNIDDLKVNIIDTLELLIYYLLCSQLHSYVFNEKENQQIKQNIQNTINETLKQLNTIDFDYPCLDITFMLNLIKQLNSENNVFTSNFNKFEQMEIYKGLQIFIKTIYQFIDYEDPENNPQNQQIFFQNLRQIFSKFEYQKLYLAIDQIRYDTTNLNCYYIMIIINKYIKFGLDFQDVSQRGTVQEISFYLKKLLETTRKEQKDIIVYLLIKINTLLDKGFSQNNFSYILAQNFTDQGKLHRDLNNFVNILQPKDKQIIYNYKEIVIQTKYPEYRFLSIQILLKLISIVHLIEYQQYEIILFHLCSQYLCENDQSVKIVFKNNETLQKFLRKIKININAQQKVRDCVIQKRKQLTIITEVDEQVNEK